MVMIFSIQAKMKAKTKRSIIKGRRMKKAIVFPQNEEKSVIRFEAFELSSEKAQGNIKENVSTPKRREGGPKIIINPSKPKN